jgi:hypothetical protein
VTLQDTSSLEHLPLSSLDVVPRFRGDGFQASIRGHILDLADPSSGHRLAPTPEDLLVVSIAAEIAWGARSLLRGSGCSDEVAVSAYWNPQPDVSQLADIHLTVTLPTRPDAVGAALAAQLQNRVAARRPANPALHISLKGVK